jgi:hypothetical protein
MTIKEIAGGVLLYLYLENRQDPLNIDFKNFYFRYNDNDWRDKQAFDKFQVNLLKAAENNVNDLLNAIRYLVSSGLINENNNGSDMAGLMYRDMKLTAAGTNIIEGVERKEDNTKSQFNITFNFNLESVAKITPTLKTQFGLVNL